jgi:anti-sigma-K factor RskA
MNYNRPELLQKLAGEYVLGTMSARTRRRFERILAENPSARFAVERWQDRLMPMADEWPTRAPPADLWKKIETKALVRASTVIPAAQNRPDSEQISKKSREIEKQSYFSRWFSFGNLSLLGTGAALAFAVFTIVPLLQKMNAPQVATMGGLPQSYVAVLSGADSQGAMLVSSPRYSKALSVKVLAAVTLAPNQELRLWALPKEGAPIALGAIPANGKVELAMAGTAEEVLGKIPFLGVTIEEKGTQIAALPEKFAFRGPCVKLW